MLRGDALLQWQRAEAERLGVEFPPPAKHKGRPSLLREWRDIIAAELRGGRELPSWVSAEIPPGFIHGMKLQEVPLAEHELVTEPAATPPAASAEPAVGDEDPPDGPVVESSARESLLRSRSKSGSWTIAT